MAKAKRGSLMDNSNNVRNFPSCRFIDGRWWHAGKSYVDLKESLPPGEYAKILAWDTRRALREYDARHSGGGGNAA